MPPEKTDLVPLSDMLRFAREVVGFTCARNFREFQSDLLLRRAVEHSVQLIGEAAKRVSREFEAAHPEIPWNKIIVQRHRIVHEYDRIDEAIIWSVAVKYVPELIRELEKLVPTPPPDPEPEDLDP